MINRKKINQVKGYNISHKEMEQYIDDIDFWKQASEESYLDTKYVHMNKPQSGRATTKRKIIPCSISKKEFLEEYDKHKIIMKTKYNDDGRRCRYCENKLTYMIGYKNTNVSIDRIDNTKGYQKGNIVFSCGSCNDVKNQITLEMCKNVIRVANEME